MEEVDNIFPQIKRIFFNSSQRQYVNLIRQQSDEICRMKIRPEYIKTSFNNFKKGIIYQENNKIVGFVIWKDKTIIPKGSSVKNTIKKIMDILLICSNHTNISLARLIFSDLEEYCKENYIRCIRLYPANEKLRELYSLYGFESVSNKYTSDVDMCKHLGDISIPRNKTRKARRESIKKFKLSYNETNILNGI
jgi:uncharacterized protein (UPF0297 family)